MYLIQIFAKRIIQNKNLSSECCSAFLSGRKGNAIFFISGLRRVSNSTEEENQNGKSVGDIERKLLKVAILGRPNAGKSTLINRILQMNVCDVSSKTHTTRFPVRTAFVSGKTQIIFVDTPGLVTKKEFSRFDLKESFLNWKKSVLPEVDIIGVIQEACLVRRSVRFHSILFQTLKEIEKPVFLILNKVDMVQNKTDLLQAVNSMNNNGDGDSKSEKSVMKFSNIFFTSALKGNGISEIVDYLLENAKENEWILEEGKVCDAPVEVLITNLIRAKVMNILPQEVPYVCRYQVEYLEENNFGELICVALVTCKYLKHKIMIIDRKKKYLSILCKEIESDLYNILKKVVRLRLVVETAKKKPERNFRTSFPSKKTLTF